MSSVSGTVVKEALIFGVSGSLYLLSHWAKRCPVRVQRTKVQTMAILREVMANGASLILTSGDYTISGAENIRKFADVRNAATPFARFPFERQKGSNQPRGLVTKC
jgi:precorrin-6B methylase 1